MTFKRFLLENAHLYRPVQAELVHELYDLFHSVRRDFVKLCNEQERPKGSYPFAKNQALKSITTYANKAEVAEQVKIPIHVIRLFIGHFRSIFKIVEQFKPSSTKTTLIDKLTRAYSILHYIVS